MEHHDIEEISLRELIETLLKGKKIIAIFTMVAILLGVVFTFASQSDVAEARTIISYNYEGIEKGLSPAGTKLDLEQIKSPLILNEVITELELDKDGITADNLRRNMDIKPIIPTFIVEKIKKLREAGDEDYSYFPNEYMIMFNIKKSLKISKSQGQKILDLVVDKYITHFNKYFSDDEILSNALKGIEVHNYDYPEASVVLKNQISIMVNYLNGKNQDAAGRAFRSKTTGMSFNDIIESLKLVRDIELNRMDSVIGAYNLTKNKEKLILSYEHKIRMTDLDRQKKSEESRIAINMMDNFKKDNNSTLLIPGMGITDGVNVDKGPDYYDKLAEMATNAGIDASGKSLDIRYYNEEIHRLTEDTVGETLKTKAAEDVMEMMANIEAKLNNLIEITDATVSEYYETKLDNSIMKLSPVELYRNSKLKLNTAISLVLGLMLGVFVVFFKAYWENTKTTERA